MTSWQPKVPGDIRLPGRMRTDWPQLLRSAGFTDIKMEARPEWHDQWTRVYQIALDTGNPGADVLLGELQDEARRRLPMADLCYRVTVIAAAPAPE